MFAVHVAGRQEHEDALMKASVFVGTSLDGFIARANGEYDFLPPGGGEPHGYEEFMATVDALVIGRHTAPFWRRRRTLGSFRYRPEACESGSSRFFDERFPRVALTYHGGPFRPLGLSRR